MTKKQYKHKVMKLLREFKKEQNITQRMMTDRINMPKWGSVITIGTHKGEILISYQRHMTVC